MRRSIAVMTASLALLAPAAAPAQAAESPSAQTKASLVPAKNELMMFVAETRKSPKVRRGTKIANSAISNPEVEARYFKDGKRHFCLAGYHAQMQSGDRPWLYDSRRKEFFKSRNDVDKALPSTKRKGACRNAFKESAAKLRVSLPRTASAGS